MTYAQAEKKAENRNALSASGVPQPANAPVSGMGNAQKNGGTAKFETLYKGNENTAKTRELQERLVRLGYSTNGIDGIYGGGTFDAVMQFQSDNGLSATGVADAATQSVLYSKTSASGGTSSVPPQTAGYVTLAKGNKDNDRTYKLQSRLVELGYSTNGVDGIFGSGTLKAVRAFQSDHGLPVTGVADAATQSALFGSIGPAPVQEPAADAAGSDYVVLAKGCGDAERTLELQKRLSGLGYSTNGIDGIYGNGTFEAVSQFQRDNGLAPTGVADIQTQELLCAKASSPVQDLEQNSESGQSQHPDPPQESADTENQKDDTAKPVISTSRDPADYPILEKGSDDAKRVRELQSRLMQLGYSTNGLDGVYGGGTVNAVTEFQADCGLPQTGIADSVTQALLHEKAQDKLIPDNIPPSDSSLSPICAEDEYKGNENVSRNHNSYEKIMTMQRHLKRLDYYHYALDGKWGKGTSVALMTFQYRANMMTDGISTVAHYADNPTCTSDTWALLRQNSPQIYYPKGTPVAFRAGIPLGKVASAPVVSKKYGTMGYMAPNAADALGKLIDRVNDIAAGPDRNSVSKPDGSCGIQKLSSTFRGMTNEDTVAFTGGNGGSEGAIELYVDRNYNAGLAAVPGRSMHCSGQAVDIQGMTKDSDSNLHRWIVKNYKGVFEEYSGEKWHFNYVGG